MYGNELKTYSYVCPHCFNIVKECVCPAFPENLVQIDKRMVPIIKKLNDMNYKTTGCCEGHIDNFDKIYIFFFKKYKFKKPLPDGFIGDGSYLSAHIIGKSDSAKKRRKRLLLKALYEWVCSLEKV